MVEQHSNCVQYFMAEEGDLIILVGSPNKYLKAYLLKKGDIIRIDPDVYHIAVNGTDNCKFWIFNANPENLQEPINAEIKFTCIGNNSFDVIGPKHAAVEPITPPRQYPTISILGAV